MLMYVHNNDITERPDVHVVASNLTSYQISLFP